MNFPHETAKNSRRRQQSPSTSTAARGKHKLIRFTPGEGRQDRKDAALWGSVLEKAWELMGSLAMMDSDWLSGRLGRLSKLWEHWLTADGGGVLAGLQRKSRGGSGNQSPPAATSLDEARGCRAASTVAAAWHALRALYITHPHLRGRVAVRAAVGGASALRGASSMG
eukprot:jgi/Bigna1/72753/fgenesh1_pg.21_\